MDSTVDRETPLEMARRHVREAEERVTKFRAIAQGTPERCELTNTSGELLAMFEKTLTNSRASLARLKSHQRARKKRRS